MRWNKIDDTASLKLNGEFGGTFVMHYTNRGDPFDEGCSIELWEGQPGMSSGVSVDLMSREADQLLEVLAKLRGKKVVNL